MSAFRRWLGRKAALFIIIILAVSFFTLIWPQIRADTSRGTLAADWMSPQQIADELASSRTAAQERLERNVASLRGASEAERQRRLVETTADLGAARRTLGEFDGFLDTVRPTRILERKRLELRISELELEIKALRALSNEYSARGAARAAQLRAQQLSLVPTEAAIRVAQQRCREATEKVKSFERRAAIDQVWRNVTRDERSRLERQRRDGCQKAEEAVQKREAGVQAQREFRKARERFEAAQNWTPGAVQDVSRGIPETVVRDILLRALLLFAFILALPLLIRCLFYYVLAPIAERRPPIRLSEVNASESPSSVVADRSRTSVSLQLLNGDELLVRQGFLQATSEAGLKGTQWLLDWRHPLSSIASGLTFLTRIRGSGSLTTVSAVRDPLAEVTILHLARDASYVLHPRALAAVVQRIDDPLKITSHWRLNSLHAWLTLQLRYLVFHGPARLVVKGSRGVRVELAESGRIFGQQQLVGFSTNLAYTVRRTETFWPYLLGHEQLLKDRVHDGKGVLIIEEAPMSGRQGLGVRRGLEGAFDASLKAFGL